MSTQTLPASKARSNLYKMLDDVKHNLKYYTISKKGEDMAVLISSEEYTSLQETVEVMNDKELIKSIQKGLNDVNSKRVISSKDLKKKLGI